MNPDGSGQVNLTQHRANDLHAVWSPTGEKILFISDRGGMRDLYLMNPDGSNQRRIFKRKTKLFRKSPTWSPDGKQFAYVDVNWDTVDVKIHIATLGEQDTVPIAEGSYPAWSPDGTEIACSVRERLTLINIRTGAQKQILPKKAPFLQRQPSWSATGDKLAFSWNTHKPPPFEAKRPVWDAWQDKQTIFIVNRDGTGLKQLVEENGPYAWAPALSPNGDEVLYTQEIDKKPQIFKLNVNSGTRTQLTHDGFPRFGNFGGNWFDPAHALPVEPQPHLLTTTWAAVKKTHTLSGKKE
jgi:Tol biopolymer transport system component